ncbi:MAG: magnesium chelatase ATPase subunit D, partial [Alphaproteobacteria bacterium]|nr:magnesium chelatase ATPase subunit D [Alphaproteobacteria bacterium]
MATGPFEMGGAVLRTGPGPVRDRWCSLLVELLGGDTPVVRLPVNAGPERLMGDVDISATLGVGRIVMQPGLLGAADGGVIVVPSAERLEAFASSVLCTALDTGGLRIETDGLSKHVASRFCVVAFDERQSEEEGVAHALSERLALQCDLTMISYRDVGDSDYDRARIQHARALLGRVAIDDRLIRGLCEAVLACGIGSGRAELFALHCARRLAALDGRLKVTDSDVAAAARLVLQQRIVAFPIDQTEPEEDDQDDQDVQDADQGRDADQQRPRDDSSDEADDAERPTDRSTDELSEMIVETIRYDALGNDVLSRLDRGGPVKATRGANGRQASRRLGLRRGKASGVRRYKDATGGRLNLIASLRAAAPWQKIRRDAMAGQGQGGLPTALIVHRDDLRISRYREQQGSTIVFLVDASGSTALGRLAEAKGAVEMLLFDSYRRRDRVALISFRGDRASV